MTGATPKLGIKHKDWADVGTTYYGPIDGNGGQPDHLLLHALINDKPFHTASQNGALIAEGLSGFFKDVNPEYGAKNIKSHAYHFDAFKVGKYFQHVI